MKWTSLTIAVRCAIFTVAIAGSAVAQDAEEYRVYDAVIRYMFRDGTTQFDMNAKVDKIVIRDHTSSDYAWSPEKENWEQVKIRLRSLSDDTIAGYESARKKEVDLKAKTRYPAEICSH